MPLLLAAARSSEVPGRPGLGRSWAVPSAGAAPKGLAIDERCRLRWCGKMLCAATKGKKTCPDWRSTTVARHLDNHWDDNNTLLARMQQGPSIGGAPMSARDP